MEDTPPDFRGKVLAIYFMARPDMRDGAIVENVRFERQAGRLFLVGTIPVGINPEDWNAGLTTCIAWDAVAEYTIFESVADYRERARRVPQPRAVH